MKFTIPKPRRTPSLRQHADKTLTAGALADRVKTARERLEHQHDPALLEAYSEQELANKRDAAEKIRDIQLQEQLAQIRSAAAAAERDRRTRSEIAERDAKDLVLARDAITDQRRESSPHAKLAYLQRRKRAMLRNLTYVAGFGMLVSAVTVQQNIAPGHDLANPMFWLAYGLEALISGVLITLMLTTADVTGYGVLKEQWKERAVEASLLALTITLNVYPFIRNGDGYSAFAHVIAPMMIAVALTAHVRVANNYGLAIKAVTAEVPDTDDITARLAELTWVTAEPDQVARFGTATTDPAPALGPAVRDAEPRTAERDYGPTAGTTGEEPVVRADTRSTGDDPVPAPVPPVAEPVVRGPVPAAEPVVLDGKSGQQEQESASDLGKVRTRTENPQSSDDEESTPAVESEAATSDDATISDATEDHSPSTPAEQQPGPAVRSRTPRTNIGGWPETRTAGSEAIAPQRQDWMTPIYDLATEVQRRGAAPTKPLEVVAAAIAAIDAGASNNAIEKETPLSHRTIANIREKVAGIRHENSGGGRVIELRKQGV